MKKLIFATLLSILSVAGFANGIVIKRDDSKEISYNAKQQLEAEFANAKNVTWKITDEYQKATFSLAGKQVTAIFDIQGVYLGAVQVVTFDELPADAVKSIEKHYKDYDFAEALKVISRPVNDYQNNDVGTYWIDLTKNTKQLVLNFSDMKGLTFYQATENATNARN